MLVTVRLFARLRELAGTAELTQELPDNASARTAWDSLTGRFPAMREYERSISCAVNEEYAQFATLLKDGDEVAFLPPVSGGKWEVRSGKYEVGSGKWEVGSEK